MASFEELGDKYESKLKSISNFKIGKSRKTAQEKFNEDYADIYNHYDTIGSSENSTTIDDFEKYMIKRFKELPNLIMNK